MADRFWAGYGCAMDWIADAGQDTLFYEVLEGAGLGKKYLIESIKENGGNSAKRLISKYVGVRQ